MSETDLAIIEQPPAEVVERGTAAAKQLQKIVSSREKKLLLGGKQYLFFEDWQTIGKFYGVTVKTVHTEELREGDELIGFLAQAVAVANGIEVSGADAECTYDEDNWHGKPRYQLRSMAQTRACSKALRNCLGWVAVLAGYEATPAEEMSGVKEAKGHFCKEHKTPFFKKGKMRGYSHPIGDTGEWCNEEVETTATAVENTTEMEDTVTPVTASWEWIKTSMQELQAKGVTSMSNKNIVTYLNSLTGAKKEDVKSAVSALNEQQVHQFTAEINQALDDHKEPKEE